MTFNTGNPIGSTDARDLSDNSENLDLAVNSLSQTFVDRLGVTRDTLEGIYQKSAYYRAGTFDAGYTLTSNRQTLEYSGHEYSWSGAFPKVVPAGSTPETSGGVGSGAWVDRSDVTLRSDLYSDNGADYVSYKRDVVSSLKTTVGSVLESLKFNLSEFINTAPTISAAISNMLDAANGAGCYIGAGVYNLESAITHTGTVKLLLDDGAVINFHGVWLTVTNGDYSVVAGGRLTTPTSAYMVNRWDSSYNLLPSGSYVYGADLAQGYQVSGNDPEYSDWLANHPTWLTSAATGVTFISCKHSVMTGIRGKFTKLQFTDCEFSGAFRNNVHGGKDSYGAIAFRASTNTAQRGNFAIQNLTRNATHNGICWEGQISFKCWQNQSLMNGESNYKRMQNTYPSVGCDIANNDSHAAFYDGFDTLTNFPPTGAVTTKRYFVHNNRSTGCRYANYSAEGTVDFFDNDSEDCGTFGVWGKYLNNSRFRGGNFVNCNDNTSAGYAALYVEGNNNKLIDMNIDDASPVNIALYLKGNNNSYSFLKFDSAYSAPLYVEGTGNHGFGNRGVKSQAGTDLDDYLLTDFDNFDGSAAQVGIGFRVRNTSNKRIAKILASLTVPSANGMYSELDLYMRKSGEEINALKLSSPSGNGQTYATLQVQTTEGATVSRRVKVGASGTGPSGGRALYTDA